MIGGSRWPMKSALTERHAEGGPNLQRAGERDLCEVRQPIVREIEVLDLLQVQEQVVQLPDLVLLAQILHNGMS